ncbi:EAL domain-containing protein [candidate division CSSED10-310 bacterium]|uniref:EAL domain-containing protein n=1 Tax=candidate division CSSED10-310 bacterium TaxID=2855610 RepID=A0ABV6YVI0_UNCC1
MSLWNIINDESESKIMLIDRYAILPEPLPREGTLYLAPPMDHTIMKIRNVARRCGTVFSETQFGVIGIPLTGPILETFADDLENALLPSELEDTKAFILPPSESISLMHMTMVDSLDFLLARFKSEWLVEIFHENRFFMFFQPIVNSQNPQDVFGYECLLRARNAAGDLIFPKPIFDIARRADLLFYLDQAFRIDAIKDAARHEISQSLFINFNPISIYDPVQCVRTTVQTINEANISPQRIVFEVVESDEVKDTNHLLQILDFYRKSGFKVALDDLGAGYNSLNMMAKIKPDFIKIDIELITDVHRDHYKAVVVSKLIEMAQKLNVITVAEGIENKEDWLWVKNHNIDYVQGYLFARPASPPPQPVVP